MEANRYNLYIVGACSKRNKNTVEKERASVALPLSHLFANGRNFVSKTNAPKWMPQKTKSCTTLLSKSIATQASIAHFKKNDGGRAYAQSVAYKVSRVSAFEILLSLSWSPNTIEKGRTLTSSM